jgi:hypothetical protein
VDTNIPGLDDPEDLAAGRERLGLSSEALWLGYISVGGNGTLSQVRRWLDGSSRLSDREYDLLAQALNDEFTDRGMNHPVSYRGP